MSEVVALFRIYDLPWSAGSDQDREFRKILATSFGALLVLALLFSILPVREPDPAEMVEIPERFARLILEEPAPPPPPPVVVEEQEPEPVVEEAEPEQVVEIEPEREPEPEPQQVAEVEPEPVAEPVDETQQARERAAAALLPFAQELASLRDNETLGNLEQTEMVGNGDPEAAPVAERSLITSRVGSRSGGINTAEFSRNTGGGGLAARATTQVESPVESLGPAGGAVRRAGDSNRGSRSREEIERVFDLNKGAIYALYNRALRQNPLLEGKLVLRLTISPEGVVTFCEVVSSELGDPELERRLVQRVLLFQFEAKDVESITTTKPIDFFPA